MASMRRRGPHAQVLCRLWVGLSVLAVVSILIMVQPPPAAAAPLVAGQSDDLEQVIEEYDRVSGLLALDQAKATTLAATVKTLDRELATAQARLLPVVHRVYEVGSVTPMRVLMDTPSTAGLVDQLGMAEAFAHRQHAQTAAFLAARVKALAAKKKLDAAIVVLTARKADLAARKRTILAGIAAQQALARHVTDLSSPSPLRPAACPFTPIGGPAGVAVRVACAQIGKKYVWAAAGPDTFDCSGLMVYAWARAGVRLRHYTGWQWHDATPVSAAQLRPGDLVFFFPPTMHHVGMYVGGGWIVDAPHTGDVVRMERMNLRPIGGYRRP
jgi:peptidoglycan DL-endopeptidase CwlO